MNEEEARALAESIVYAIWRDLTDRRGLRHEWDAIYDDIKAEILQGWIRMAARTLTGNTAPNRSSSAWRLFEAQRGPLALDAEPHDGV